ncbi:MAG TPA: enoyl-CoA hydratase [Rhodocyclaceae bacterium]|nr:enoyl-CoA hydratase [Rhodocyclaceae bacterium]
MSEHILANVDNGVLRIEISRRGKKNALTQAMYAALSDALASADADDEIGVVLLCGQDDLFTAGNDLQDFLSRNSDDPSEGARFMQVIAALGKPLVAAVAGNAVGIGTTMLLHCDLVYAADNARFQLPFVPLGLCPEAGSSLLLPRLAGHHRAAELLFFGEPFDAAAAREIGLVNALHPQHELLAAAAARAAALARLPRASLAATKALMKRASAASVADAMQAELLHFSELVAAPVAKEIFAAFLEKRAPDFSRIAGKRP